MPPTERPIPTILAELVEVRRHLHDAPPHHGGGTDDLRSRLDRLQAELARARARQGTPAPPSGPGQPPSRWSDPS